MSKKNPKPALRPMTIYPTETLYNQIEALGDSDDGRKPSPMAVILLERAVKAASMPSKEKPATD